MTTAVSGASHPTRRHSCSPGMSGCLLGEQDLRPVVADERDRVAGVACVRHGHGARAVGERVADAAAREGVGIREHDAQRRDGCLGEQRPAGPPVAPAATPRSDCAGRARASGRSCRRPPRARARRAQPRSARAAGTDAAARTPGPWPRRRCGHRCRIGAGAAGAPGTGLVARPEGASVRRPATASAGGRPRAGSAARPVGPRPVQAVDRPGPVAAARRRRWTSRTRREPRPGVAGAERDRAGGPVRAGGVPRGLGSPRSSPARCRPWPSPGQRGARGSRRRAPTLIVS